MNTQTQRVDVPAGMHQVSKEQFWNAVMSEKRNIHPSSEKFYTNWMIVGTQTRWGWTSRGFAGPFQHDGAPTEVFAHVGGGQS